MQPENAVFFEGPYDDRLLKLKQVEEITGACWVHLRSLVDKDAFPAPRLFATRYVWLKSEIDQYMNNLPKTTGKIAFPERQVRLGK